MNNDKANQSFGGRFWTVVTAFALLVAAGSMVYLATLGRQPTQVNPVKIITAAKAYAADLKTQGLPVPAEVRLKELIQRGILTEADVSGFGGMEAVVSLRADGTRPDEVLMRVRLADGHELVAMTDGSVQQIRK